jgi:hypothetical protein
MAESNGNSATVLPGIEEFVAGLSQIEPIHGLDLDVPVIQAVLTTGATLTVKVNGKGMSSDADPTSIGKNVQCFLNLEKFCAKHNIPLPPTDIKDVIGGFAIQMDIWLNPGTELFDTTDIRAPFHSDSSDVAVFTALTLALSGKPFARDQILIQAYELNKYGIPAILSADAVRLQRPIVNTVHSVQPFDPFSPFVRNAVSPFPQKSVAPSQVLFVDALKANLPHLRQSSVGEQVHEVAHDSHASDASEQDEQDGEEPFTDVKNKRRPARAFVGDAASPPPASAPLGSTYNKPRFSGKISPWTAYFERGLGRGLDPAVILANYAGFVLDNKYANANKKTAADPSLYENPQLYHEFRTYMKGQLGKDFPKWEASIPV